MYIIDVPSVQYEGISSDLDSIIADDSLPKEFKCKQLRNTIVMRTDSKLVDSKKDEHGLSRMHTLVLYVYN